ncbi:transposase [Facilibium subflavum]|uniref:transposase n=1 Tax=Facilibium subflavum TaxID=2219058 RepID=UPI000E64D31B|nr:transposase [Facilibium subflavum]
MLKAKELSGVQVKEAHVDRGYRGHGITDIAVYRSGQKRGIKKRMKRRSSIEPLIGHLKSDHGMDRNYLKGKSGDKINAICAGIGINLKHVLRLLAPA